MKKSLSLFFIQILAFALISEAHLGEPVKQVESIKDGTGRLYLFILGNNGDVYYAREMKKNLGLYAGISINMQEDNKAADDWRNLPNKVFFQITVSLTDEGNVAVYGLDNVGRIYVSYQNQLAKNNSGFGGQYIDEWSNWTLIGSDFSQIASAKDRNQHLFGLKKDGSVWVNFKKNSSQWTGWKSLNGTNLKQIACVEGDAEYKVVFALSNDGSVYLIWGKDATWSDWETLGGTLLNKIVVGKSLDSRLLLYVLGGNNSVYEKHQLTANGNWQEWIRLGENKFKDISAGGNKSGRITLFGLGIDIAVQHTWQNEPGGEDWNSWTSLGGDVLNAVHCNSTEDGRMVVFVIGGDGKIYYRIQEIPDGKWIEWRCISDQFKDEKYMSLAGEVNIETENNTGKKIIIIDKNYTPPITPVDPTPVINCTKSQGYWFANSNHPWPDVNGLDYGNVKVAGFDYSEAEGRAIWNASNQGGISESKKAFLFITALKLSKVTETLPIWNDVKACQKLLKPLGKLDPSNLPPCDQRIKNIISRINDWIETHHCEE